MQLSIQSLNRIILSSLYLVLLLSCKNDNLHIKEISGKNGLKEIYFYNENGANDSIHYLKNGILFCKNIIKGNLIAIENFYPHGSTESRGYKQDGKFVGEWQYFSKNGQLLKELEYKIICDSSYLNQGRFYKENGDIDKEKSNFYEVRKKNVYKVNEKFELIFYYNRLSANSTCELCLNPEINDDFCDLDRMNFVISRFSSDTLIAKIGFASKGKKELRGYIKEEFLGVNNTVGQRIIYLDIPLLIE